MNISTPVAFLIFNRLENTEKVFAEIAKAKPAQLLIVADGPRIGHPDDIDKCAAVRNIVSKVDWNCEVLTNFAETNLGCKLRVSSGLDWVFDNVAEAIILEDDCVPSQSFFKFCGELLEYYRHDTRIMQISGSNYFSTNVEESYYFSKYSPIWGWATWRRAWKYYDVDMKLWPVVKQKRLHYDFCYNLEEIVAREAIFDSVYKGDIDTWDYQWGFARFINSGISVTPCKNLISNIGIGEDATHTKDINDIRANIYREELEFPIRHPMHVIRNHALDFQYFEKVIVNRNNSGWFNKELNKIKKVLCNQYEKFIK